MKRDKYDAIFSDCIRIRENQCERCELQFPDFPQVRDKNFQCSHFISRGHASTRFHPNNCFALCGGCHLILGRDPAEHYEFVLGKLGPVLLDDLRAKKHKPCRRRKADMAKLLAHYKDEFERLNRLRREGNEGRLEFEGFGEF